MLGVGLWRVGILGMEGGVVLLVDARGDEGGQRGFAAAGDAGDGDQKAFGCVEFREPCCCCGQNGL